MKKKDLLYLPFEAERDGLTIRGKIVRKDADGQPIVVISHGFMGNHKTVMQYAEWFAGKGYAAFVFDFNGGGVFSKSDGKQWDMTVFSEREDLKAVIGYAKKQSFVNAEDITLMGCSQGGFVSGLTAAELKKGTVKRLIMFYPALCIPDDARAGHMMFAKFDPDNIPERIKCGPMKLGRCYAESVLNIDPFDSIKAYDGPVLIVHGDCDQVVNVEYGQKAYDRYTESRTGSRSVPSHDVVFTKITGAKHGFNKREDGFALEIVNMFLEGRYPVLSIDVHLTDHKVTKLPDGTDEVYLPFDGNAVGPYFKGVIQPGAADTQHWKNKKPVDLCAKYSIVGKDHTGADATVNVVNRGGADFQWIPTVTTDSEALGFLNGADLLAFLEYRKSGPMVRIYDKM